MKDSIAFEPLPDEVNVGCSKCGQTAECAAVYRGDNNVGIVLALCPDHNKFACPDCGYENCRCGDDI